MKSALGGSAYQLSDFIQFNQKLNVDYVIKVVKDNYILS